MAREIRLSAGWHPAPFDSEGNPTLCVQEYVSYLAGEPHSDQPQCVSPILTRFMVSWNDVLDDETRQRLRPYAVRQIGTAGDGQDEARCYMALDWLVRVCAPAFLAAAGLRAEANTLRGLAAIDGIGETKRAARWTEVARDAVRKTAGFGRVTTGEESRTVVAVVAGAGAAMTAWCTTWDEAAMHAWALSVDAASLTTGDALRLTGKDLQESAFLLLDRMIDPAGVHDIKDESACFEETGREPLVVPVAS